jgi:hypothetical protein
MACGFEIVKPSLTEVIPGQMQEIMIGKKKAANDPLHLYAQCCSYSRKHSAEEKQRGRAAHIFKDIYGDWPSRLWDFNSIPDVPITAAVLGKIKSKNIAFNKGGNGRLPQ